MTYLYIVLAVATGWCLRIIFEDILDHFYYYDLPPAEQDDITLVNKETNEEVTHEQLVNSVVLLSKTLEYTGQWLEEMQKLEPLKDNQLLTQEQWLDRAAYYAIEELTHDDKNNKKS